MTEIISRLSTALADRYKIEGELGAGGMATVYLAEDLKLHRKVALKVLRPELAAALGPERFLREIEIAAKLHHPHILALHDSGEADGFLYYVMPYVEGESLRDRLNREKQLPVEDALQIAREVADALGSAHRHDVIHRDIKPENILLEAGHAVVADFGIARAVSAAGGDRLTETGMAVGTPAYMSPEQGSGEQQLDGRSDLYALACVLYEMLAGEPPYTGPTGQAVIAKRMSEPVPHVSTLRETVSPPVEQAITKALAKAPADRFATAARFVEALKGSAATTPTRRAAPSIQRSLLVVVPLMALGLWFTMRNRLAAEEMRSIAVLACENLSGDTAQEYLSDRWTEELILKLSKVLRLRVKTWESVRGYKGTTKRDREIASELGAGTLVRCGVAQTDDSVRLQIQLIDPDNDEIIWSDDVRGGLTVASIDGIQTFAARQMADALGADIAPVEGERLDRVPTQDSEAFNRYRLGRHFWDMRTAEALRTSIEYYEQAVTLDPEFSLAYAALAEARGFLGQVGSRRPAAYWPEVRAAAERALEIDSTTAEAHSSMGKYWAVYEWDWLRADSANRRAIALDPNSPRVRLWYGQFLTIRGRHDEAIAQLERAVELDPAYAFYRVNLAWRYIYARRFEDAREELVRSLHLDSQDWVAHWTLGLVDLIMGEAGDAIEWLQQAYQLCRECITPLGHLGYAYGRAGRRSEAEGVLRELETRADTGYVSAVHFAEVHMGLGNVEDAFDWLDTAFRERSMELVHLLADLPLHDDFSNDQRFQDLRRRVGFDE